MLNFYFLEKSLGIVSPPDFVYDFSRKIFHVIFCYLAQFCWFPPCNELHPNWVRPLYVNVSKYAPHSTSVSYPFLRHNMKKGVNLLLENYPPPPLNENLLTTPL